MAVLLDYVDAIVQSLCLDVQRLLKTLTCMISECARQASEPLFTTLQQQSCHEPTIKGGQVGRMGSSASQSFRGRSRGVAGQVAQGDWLPEDVRLRANQRHSSTG